MDNNTIPTTIIKMNALEKLIDINAQNLLMFWSPHMQQVRRLRRFKELIREVGFIEYWNEYGWPDMCRPLGGNDSERS